MKKTLISIIASLLTLGFVHTAYADGHKVYGPYPITLKGYDGDKTNSVKYTGQMTRQVLHDSLKALVKTGDVEKIKANYTENTIFYDVMGHFLPLGCSWGSSQRPRRILYEVLGFLGGLRWQHICLG